MHTTSNATTITAAPAAAPGKPATPLSGLLLLNALVWTLAAWMSRGNLDVPGDMVQDYVWGIEWQAGYSAHPPLFAWVSAAWFGLMPRTDLAYYALSALNAAAGLAGVAALARRFLPAESASFAALALAVSPLYANLAIDFNANAILLSVWPWTVLFFVAFMQDGRRRDAAACGALAALSLLGKYFSVVLVCALLLAALVVPQWRHRLRGVGPWLALGVAAALLAPHVLWMFEHDFSTLRFASMRSSGGHLSSLLRLGHYVLAQAAYLSPCLLFLVWSVPKGQRRAAAAAIGGALWRPGRQPELWWLTWAPMFVVVAIVLVRRTPMASVWGMAQWFAVTPLWLAALRDVGIAPRTRWLHRALPVLWAAVVAVSAAVGLAQARHDSEEASAPRAELAKAASALWLERTRRPLTWIGGPFREAGSIAFYGPGRTRWWNPGAPETSPWASTVVLHRDGSLLVCPEADDACQEAAVALTPEPATRINLRRLAWGKPLGWHAYRLYFLLPANAS